MDFARIETVYRNVLEMIKNRGYSDESITNYTSSEFIYYKINLFLQHRNSTNNHHLDILVLNQNSKLCVQFFQNFPESGDGSTNKPSSKLYDPNLSDFYKSTLVTHMIQPQDEIIYVFLDDVMDDKTFNIVNSFENSKKNIRIFFYKNLMYSPVKHKLVPHHTLFKGNRSELYKKLMIDTYYQLPAILSCDPICKYYNFKPGDIIEIHRRNVVNNIHIIYRYVKLFTDESPGKESYF